MKKHKIFIIALIAFLIPSMCFARTQTPAKDIPITDAGNFYAACTGSDKDVECALQNIASGSGETNTASNTGSAGVGVFKQKTLVDLEFYKLNSSNPAITILLDGTDKIDFGFDESQIDHENIGNVTTSQHHPKTVNLNDLSDVDTTGKINKSRIGWSVPNSKWEIMSPEAEKVNITAKAGEAISANDIVYISGESSGQAVVSLANSTNTSKMPAIGIALESASTNDDIEICTFGNVNTTDTSAYNVNDLLYVDTSDGGTTKTKPIGTAKIQKIAEVMSVGVNGHIFVFGAGRSNDIPNIPSAKFWLGDSDGVPQEVSMSSEASMDNVGAVTISSSHSGSTHHTVTDSVTVNGVAVDTTANFLDGDILMTLVDGGAGGPDDITMSYAANSIDDTHPNWGTGANQISADDLPIADGGSIITATEVEGALQENRTAIDINTAKVTSKWEIDGSETQLIVADEIDMRTKKIINVVDPVNSQDVATKEYVDMSVSFINTYFYNDTASDIGGIYFKMLETSTGEAESTFTTASLGAGDGQALTNFATDTNIPGVTLLKSGVYAGHIHAERTVGNRDVNIFFEIYTRTSGGTETLRATSEDSDLITSRSHLLLHATISESIVINSTDRIIIKYLADLGSGNATTIALYAEGTNASRLDIPTTTEILSSVFVRQDGTTPLTANWNLGNFDITLAGALFAGILSDNDDMVFEIDADDNGSNSYIWTDGASTQIATLSEAGAFQIADDMIVSGGDITFGNITARIGDSVTDSVSIVTDGGTVVMDGNINSSTLTISEILITDGSKNIVSAPVATYPSLAELAYVKGVTSAIQGQIDSKTGDQVIPWEADKTIETPTDADNFIIVPKVPAAITIGSIRCIVEDATSATIRIDECDLACDNCAGIDGATTIVCDVDGQDDDGSLSNAGIDADDCLRFVVTAVNGTVGQVAVSIIGTRD